MPVPTGQGHLRSSQTLQHPVELFDPLHHEAGHPRSCLKEARYWRRPQRQEEPALAASRQRESTFTICTFCEPNTLTRHIFTLIHNTFNVTLTLAQVQGVARTSSHVSSAWCRRCLDTLPLHTPHHLSYLPPHSPGLHFQLPCGLVRA